MLAPSKNTDYRTSLVYKLKVVFEYEERKAPQRGAM